MTKKRSASECAADFVNLQAEMDFRVDQLAELGKLMYGKDSKVKVSYEKKSDKDGVAYKTHVAMSAEDVGSLRVLERTVYIRHELRGTAVDNNTEAMIKVLIGTNNGHIVDDKPRVPWKSMQGWLNELDKDEDGMPILPNEELDSVINITQRDSVRSRKSA